MKRDSLEDFQRAVIKLAEHAGRRSGQAALALIAGLSDTQDYQAAQGK